jgi:hypothetical protein
VFIIPSSWGSQLDGYPARIKLFLAPLPGKKKISARGVSHAHPLLCFSFAYFTFACMVLSKIQKNSYPLYLLLY